MTLSNAPAPRLALHLLLGPRLAPLVGAALLFLVGTACSAELERPRNAVLFCVDTLRADRLGCYGYGRETSPHIDRLAARGTLYRAAYPQGAWTVPSMISLMSGLYVTDPDATQPPADQVLLAETLERNGWSTAAFVGNKLLVRDRGFRRGFGHFEALQHDGTARSLIGGFQNWYRTRRESIRAGKGFFAWIHPFDPHNPWRPPEQDQLFLDQPRPDEQELVRRWRAHEPRREAIFREAGMPVPELLSMEEALADMRQLNNLYDGEVVTLDRAFGELIAFLEEQQELEHTLIVFCADHGEQLWEHPYYPDFARAKAELELLRDPKDFFAWGHRSWFHQESWSTPLILAGPGMPAGRTVEGLAANLDVYPTLLDALGLLQTDDELAVLPGALHGQSLLGGRVPARETVFGIGKHSTALVDRQGRKLIQHDPRRYLQEPGTPRRVELFDLSADPHELQDLAGSEAELAGRLTEQLERWRQLYSGEFSHEISEEDLKALEELGYVGDGDLVR